MFFSFSCFRLQSLHCVVPCHWGLLVHLQMPLKNFDVTILVPRAHFPSARPKRHLAGGRQSQSQQQHDTPARKNHSSAVSQHGSSERTLRKAEEPLPWGSQTDDTSSGTPPGQSSGGTAAGKFNSSSSVYGRSVRSARSVRSVVSGRSASRYPSLSRFCPFLPIHPDPTPPSAFSSASSKIPGLYSPTSFPRSPGHRTEAMVRQHCASV